LAARHPAVGDGRTRAPAAGDRARRRLHARRTLLRGRRRSAYTAALVLVGGGGPNRRGSPAPRRNDQGRARPASWPGTGGARGGARRLAGVSLRIEVVLRAAGRRGAGAPPAEARIEKGDRTWRN